MDSYLHLGLAILQQCRQEHEVIVLHPDHVAVIVMPEDDFCKLLISCLMSCPLILQSSAAECGIFSQFPCYAGVMFKKNPAYLGGIVMPIPCLRDTTLFQKLAKIYVSTQMTYLRLRGKASLS